MSDLPATAELQAICEVCLLAIEDGQGAVWVRPPWPGSRRAPDDVTSLGGLEPARPEREAWHVSHDECDARSHIGYRIEVERIRTWAAYLHWTGHLMSKDWIADTNWNDLIMDSLNPTSTATGGIRPRTLRDPGHRHVGD